MIMENYNPKEYLSIISIKCILQLIHNIVVNYSRWCSVFILFYNIQLDIRYIQLHLFIVVRFQIYFYLFTDLHKTLIMCMDIEINNIIRLYLLTSIYNIRLYFVIENRFSKIIFIFKHDIIRYIIISYEHSCS